jgi:hypothetical protein
MKPLFNPNAKRLKITYGPYLIKSSSVRTLHLAIANISLTHVQDNKAAGNSPSMDPHGTSFNNLAGDDFPRDVTVLQSQSTLLNEDFTKSDIGQGIYNHHNVFFDVSKPMEAVLTCGNEEPKATLGKTVIMAGATEDAILLYTNKGSNLKTGLYISKTDKILIGVDVVNYNKDAKLVYTVSEIEFLEGRPEGTMNTVQQTINIGMCNGMDGLNIRPPQGQEKFSLNGSDITFLRDGYLIQSRESQVWI